MKQRQAIARVEVIAPARLHLGFLDLDGGLGRRYGSLGLAVDGIGTRLALAPAAAAEASGPSAERALGCLVEAAQSLGLDPAVRVTVESAIPPHAGLGSGTQLALAVAAALARLNGRSPDAARLAAAVDRGVRSGIGIGAFERGGFLVDGGRDDRGAPAPIIARLPFPDAWRILLVLDTGRRGLHGAAEHSAFAALPRFDEALAGRLCRVLVMRVLPGLAECDFTAVAEGLGEIQERLGDHFAGAQGGRFSSPAVAAALAWLRAEGLVGLGQSSWGPTGFALVDSSDRARELEEGLRARFGGATGLGFRIVAGRNRGAEVTVHGAEGKAQDEQAPYPSFSHPAR